MYAARPALRLGGRDSAGAMALRVGGESGSSDGEGSGCPRLLRAPHPPGCLLQRNMVQGGFSRVGAGAAGWAGSVRDLRVGWQPTVATPVGLPEAPVQLLQL